MGFSLRFWNLELDIILFKVYLRKEDIVSCHATTCIKTVKEMQVFPCVCIISAEPFFPRKSGLTINSTHAWSLLKHLTRYMRFRLKGNSSVILMIKTWKGEGWRDGWKFVIMTQHWLTGFGGFDIFMVLCKHTTILVVKGRLFQH